MKKINKYSIIGALIMSVSTLPSCDTGTTDKTGYTEINYEQTERDRYDNVFTEENIPEQWEAYGCGDPFLLRWNGEYYLFVSTKDNNPGYKVWKSRDLVNFEYLGHKGIYNSDGTTTGQLGQYAPEIYYWNGDFYMVGSPSGNGHYIYKSNDKTPYGDYYAVTNNFGLSIDGSIFIDDDESMYFLSAASGGINAYRMNSITSVDASSETMLNTPLVKWTEGPCMIKYDGTYYITYTGNHVKSTGYRIDYSYSTTSPMEDFNYPSNNSIALNSLVGDQVGLGHSSTVLGPNLDSYYISYHNLDDSSGPIRSYNINRISFSDNRMNIYGPTESGAQVAMMPDFVNYDGGSNMIESGSYIYSSASTESTFSVEYNFKNISNISSMKLLFSMQNESDDSNYILIEDHTISLYVNSTKIGEGTLVNDFDFESLHTVRLQQKDGTFAVYFDNMQKIKVTGDAVSGGMVGYYGLTSEQTGATTFSNDAFGTSDKKESKIIGSDWFATKYLDSISNVGEDAIVDIEQDDVDYDYIYQDAKSVKLDTVGQYITYPIDVLDDGLYGIEATFRQANAGSRISIQIDNEDPMLITLPDNDFVSNMNSYEDDLQFVKNLLAEVKMTKGLHTLKIELVKGEAEFVYFNTFADSEYSPNFENDLSSYVSNGASYLSLWKIVQDDDGTYVHKALSGVNNMVLFGTQNMTDYVVEVDIKMTINAAASSQTGIIVRCNNPSLYSGQVDYSAQGYYVSFDRMQLMMNRLNYNNITTCVTTGSYTLGEWHHVKVTCKGNLISVNFDGVDQFSYRDPNPYSHGLVALYSINCESYFKNLSIKGI